MKVQSKIIDHVLKAGMIAAVLLLIPLIAMLFSGEMKWSFFDFVAAFILFFGAIFTYRLLADKLNSLTFKAAVAVAVGTALFLVWSNLAVGLIGSEDNEANAMYAGVLFVGLIGAIIARLRPKGMSYALYAVALAHIIVTAIALICNLGFPENSRVTILMINLFFITLWVSSALLFQYSSEKSDNKLKEVNK